jgi:hypothetical protein
MNHRAIRNSLMLAATGLATHAFGQLPAIPASVAGTSWARDYKLCTDRAILMPPPQPRGDRPPSPEERVALAEKECADRLGIGATGTSNESVADPADVERFKAIIRRDLLSHVGVGIGAVTVARIAPSSAPPAQRDMQATPLPMQCATGKTDVLAGSTATAGARYAVPAGMSVTVPTTPPSGWKLVRCDSNQVAFAHSDPNAGVVVTALASLVTLGMWAGDDAFEDSVRRVAEKSVVPGQQVRILSVKSTSVDGRPCVEILRAGSLDPSITPTGVLTRPTRTRERLRTCHLRDGRDPTAAVFAMVKEISPTPSERFDAVANPFIEGTLLPAWSR